MTRARLHARLHATRSAWLVTAAALCAFAAPGSAAGCSSHGARDRVAKATHPVRPAERKIIGVGSPYPADALLRPTLDKLKVSQRARRELAWRTVAKVIAPVELREPAIAPIEAGEAPTIPRWQTWYGKEDFQRIFTHLFAGLSADARKDWQPFSDASMDAALRWDATMVDSLTGWTEDRYFDRVAKVETQEHMHGLAGLTRVGYSPGALKHLLRNYGAMLDCVSDLTAIAPADPPASADQFAPCLSSEFPIDAVLVKADWRRADFGFKLPVHDTSPTILAKTLETGNWGLGEAQADPGVDAIHTMTLDNGATYRLAALHIMSKELREWLWITLWWSDKPDSDFGEDRPAFIRDLGGAWSSYKMAVVTAYDEGDPDAKGGFDTTAPSLAGALAAVNRASGARSWASNPYLEVGAANARTNCIGCHQHAGSTLTTEVILADPVKFPSAGRTRQRENFPFDYVWSTHRTPENLAGFLTDATASE